MIEIKNKAECCACTACESICPKKCITMKYDNEGFKYPLVDKEKCIDCNLCEKVCPIIHANEIKKQQHAYIFQNLDDSVRRESTSGGAFTAIAKYVLENNGTVYGVMFNSEFKVIHGRVEKEEELYKFRNSKYVQSDVGNSFSEVKKDLDSNRLVCFSGTLCHIEGLKKYLIKNYKNLILVDVVCRAVPSPLVWKKYLDMRKTKYKDIKYIMFRDKYYGYKYSNLSIYSNKKDEKSEYHSGVESDPYLRAFFSNICVRPSCYECKFKKQHRESDITLWDCFEVEKYDKGFDDDKGTTRILTNSYKGKDIIEKLSSSHKIKEIEVKEAVDGFLAMFQSVKKNNRREEFFKDIEILQEEELFKKYFSDTFKIKLERNARRILLKTGMYKQVLGVGKKFRKRD